MRNIDYSAVKRCLLGKTLHFWSIWAGGESRALQKPLRLSHSHASMAAAFALHGFAGAAFEHPLEGVADGSTGSPTFTPP